MAEFDVEGVVNDSKVLRVTLSWKVELVAPAVVKNFEAIFRKLLGRRTFPKKASGFGGTLLSHQPGPYIIEFDVYRQKTKADADADRHATFAVTYVPTPSSKAPKELSDARKKGLTSDWFLEAAVGLRELGKSISIDGSASLDLPRFQPQILRDLPAVRVGTESFLPTGIELAAVGSQGEGPTSFQINDHPSNVQRSMLHFHFRRTANALGSGEEEAARVFGYARELLASIA